MGGMAAFIPSKDPEENAIVTEKVLSDKTLETENGHDGTWIAHPGLADIANNVFTNAFEIDMHKSASYSPRRRSNNPKRLN